jgi:S1-C subfamily serine protease
MADVLPPPVPPRPRVRDRILPRSVLGLSSLILFTALGAAFSGTVLYSYYQYRLDQNEKKVTKLVDEAAKSLKDAKKLIDAEKENAKKEIRDQLGPLKQLAASEDTISKLAAKIQPSVWFVHTTDENGQPSVGTAFVVASDGNQTFLVTSLAPVRAATRQPGPVVMVRNGQDDMKAQLWTWQESRDLALLIIDKPNQPKLPWVSSQTPTRLGERVFAVAGVGGSGASVTQGFVADIFAEGISHTALVGAAFRGAPLVNSNGEVVGVASDDYGPLGFFPGDVTFAVPINRTCERILRCPSGNAGGAGQQGGA